MRVIGMTLVVYASFIDVKEPMIKLDSYILRIGKVDTLVVRLVVFANPEIGARCDVVGDDAEL